MSLKNLRLDEKAICWLLNYESTLSSAYLWLAWGPGKQLKANDVNFKRKRTRRN